MIELKKYAAIDIGSNAIRLLVANVIEVEGRDPIFRKSSLVRVPIRLGADVFKSKRISDENIERMIDTMEAFKLLMRSHKVVAHKACATSAMREAENGEEVVKIIKKKTGVQIGIIDGKDEAAIIANTDLKSLIATDRSYLYVDVGGGSTEFTLYSGGEVVNSRSFKLGTVRLLEGLVGHSTWYEVESWIKEVTKGHAKIDLIGSGGNINKIFKLSGKKEGKPLTYFYMVSFYEFLQSYTYEERVTELGLNLDRADVIIPATRIYLSAMKWSRSKNIHVPKIGLSDGIVKSLYNDKKEPV
ncbi:Ppx/GppA phosphatase family protein [Leeuwenhoekiella marinoflava]|uniref:Exopolyphosphatase/guanosine-5'-triphosphate, 3'-diphosphate pyrophosphatase n=2 Tax=Leeuwenhoekiella marinoflava TaxID=988 RepID=A0A4Q0PQA6_9FLAO|nr:rod shape-determining protein [Leeuwenhoekiella marinoflava]RXG32800.1 exopolyphosphatase/guanosine-5'-triphosphate,3'-diphosphate pyrophosphatase [Leeuwenhoekiella marinoflava]SHE57196.1 exopolyphosphatase / guanosine-5'-triphosphate,3'-diphosphate pyrophosphatase [Leeuwenhoekiella marinoflava DSM 3653]